MTRIAFTADLHIEDHGIGVDEATGLNRRFLDGIQVARFIAQDADNRGCDALIVGGDFTEKRRPDPGRVAHIAEALAEFRGLKVFVRGNHDLEHAGASFADILGRLPEGRGFSRPGMAFVDKTVICAIPYLSKHWMRAQPGFEAMPEADLYRVLGEQWMAIARGQYAEAKGMPGVERIVLAIHQGLSGGNMTDEQQAFLGDIDLVVDTAALAAIGFDAVLAGHFHLHQVLRADPLVVYSGSPQRASFQEEHQPKGYLIVDLATTPATFEFIETPARRWVTLTGEQIADDVAEEQVDGAVVRVVDLDRQFDPAQVRRILENLGAFEVTTITQRPAEVATPSSGLGEGLSPQAALDAYFETDPDRGALVDRGRRILEAVA